MRNYLTEANIFSACSEHKKRDFSQAEINYIRNHHDFKKELLSWFHNSKSDGCWTHQNFDFLEQNTLSKNKHMIWKNLIFILFIGLIFILNIISMLTVKILITCLRIFNRTFAKEEFQSSINTSRNLN